ncbi:hypothetical protein [Photobacterium leiognathi]|uniref:hypothetical protein n=1 Tax=Photobacterium leiognathi TaxID=553611 RepID=UPI002980E676|nr:hypothetical protein [Photobacterium leiognathi]
MSNSEDSIKLPISGSFSAYDKFFKQNKDNKELTQHKGKKVIYGNIHCFHEENVRDARDELGQQKTQEFFERLVAGSSIPNLTLVPCIIDGKPASKVLDGFHRHITIGMFIQYLADNGISEKTIGDVTYTNDPQTTKLPVNFENISPYEQNVFKVLSQNGRKLSDLELVTFVNNTMDTYGVSLSAVAKDICMNVSTIKNLLLLKHCPEEIKEFIANDSIKGSRVVSIMRYVFRNHDVDLRKKNQTIPQEVLDYITHLVTTEVSINNQSDDKPEQSAASDKSNGDPSGTINTNTSSDANIVAPDSTDTAISSDTNIVASNSTDTAISSDTNIVTSDPAKPAKPAKSSKAKEVGKKKTQLKLQTLSPKKLTNLAQLLEELNRRDVEVDEDTGTTTLKVNDALLVQISNYSKELEEIVTHNKYVDDVLNNAK